MSILLQLNNERRSRRRRRRGPPPEGTKASGGQTAGEQTELANAGEKPQEAAAGTPAPAPAGKKHIRISSGQAAVRGRGYFGGDLSIVYWKANVNHEIHETLYVPLRNDQLERALIEAAQEVCAVCLIGYTRVQTLTYTLYLYFVQDLQI